MTSLQFAILALAAYRTFQLVSDDTILDRPRAWLCRRLPEKFEVFIDCPWCAGFWISLAWAVSFWSDERAVWVAAPFAISAALVFAKAAVDALQAYEDSLED